jgi:hypothetical protein
MVGCVFVNEDTGEIKLHFLHPHGPSAFFTYPSKPDVFIVNRANNITEVQVKEDEMGRACGTNGGDECM